MKNISRSSLLFIAIIFVVPFNMVMAQGMMDPVHFQITNMPKQVKAGETFNVVIEAQMDGNWHLYSINNDPDAGPNPTKFTSLNDNIEVAGKIEESEPIVEYDPNFDAQLGFHSHEGTFTIPLKAKNNVLGEIKVEVQVFYQTCNDKSCLPPTTKTMSVTLKVTEPSAAKSGEASAGVTSKNNKDNESAFNTEIKKESKSNKAEPSDSDETGVNDVASTPEENTPGSVSDQEDSRPAHENPDEVKEIAKADVGGKGIFSFLWIAITAGFAALLTPCVFPMIPLTVSFFSKQGEGASGRNVSKAVLFGLAIVATFTLLGVLLALLIGAGGANQFASNPFVNLFIGGILIVFAISLLGAFEIRLPYQLTNWLNRKSNEKGGVIGILFMALTISAVSFSCTAPFVGGVLAATAGGAWFYPIIGMIGFSAAFACPFILFAMFPGWLESLPKSGSWMNVVKVLLGFIELAAAVKFLSNADLVWQTGLISRPFAIAIWVVIFLLAGFYVLGVYTMKHESKSETIGTGRLMLSIPFLLFSFYLIPGLLGASLGIWDAWLPPKQATDVSVVYSIAQRGGGQNSDKKDEFEVWSPDYQAAKVEAKQKGKPVFIDFTGYTCTNCRAMEANVFPLADVQDHFDDMQLVRLYTDDAKKGPELQKFQFKLTGTIALPTYAIVDPVNGEVIQKISGYVSADEFKDFLKKGARQFNDSIASNSE